jgi:hypothetical protein
MKNRNPSRVEIAKQYLTQLNDRFLSGDDKYYDIETRTYNVGVFYLHETMGKNGYEYEVREVLDENGAFKSLFPSGHDIEGTLCFLEGYLSGHFATCEMLGYTLEEIKEEGDEAPIDPLNPTNLTPEELAQEEKEDEERIAIAKAMGTYEGDDDEEEGEDEEVLPDEKKD